MHRTITFSVLWVCYYLMWTSKLQSLHVYLWVKPLSINTQEHTQIYRTLNCMCSIHTCNNTDTQTHEHVKLIHQLAFNKTCFKNWSKASLSFSVDIEHILCNCQPCRSLNQNHIKRWCFMGCELVRDHGSSCLHCWTTTKIKIEIPNETHLYCE